jgi:hypothetical protein
MGTTCSALVIRGEEAWFAHVGDSRIYLVRDDAIRQLTQDHSLVASMVREGLITPQEAEVHPRRNVLQRSMGVIPEVEIDVSPALTVQAGDIYILCSDGLHGLVRDTEMKEVAKMPLEAVTAEFVRLAIERGAHDNVTVVVAHVEPDTGEPLVEPPVEPIPLEPIPPTVEMPVAVMAPPEGGDVTVMGPLDLSSTAAEILRSGRAAALPAAEETRKAPPVAPARNNGRLLTWFLLGLIVVASAIAIIYVATQDQRVPRSAAPATQR